MPRAHPGVTIWFTGLPCSGKSSLAAGLDRRLRELDYKIEVLDGDAIRTHLSKGLGYSKEDRDLNIRRIAFVCHLLSRNGVIAVAAAISPYRAARDEARRLIGSGFLEIYLDCPLESCIRRDLKGLYRKALSGELRGMTGIDDPYEPPLRPDLILKTDQEPLEESLSRVFALLRSRGVEV